MTSAHDAAWVLAALAASVLHTGDRLPEPLAGVLAAAGLTDPGDGGQRLKAGLIRNPDHGAVVQAGIELLLRQAVQASAGTRDWAAQPDEVMLAVGRLTGSGASLVAATAGGLEGLAARLRSPGAAILDVGTGVGELAAGLAALFPSAHVTGLDVLPRALAHASHTADRHGVAGRVHLRRQDVATLVDVEAYDLAWLPTRFVPAAAVEVALPRLLVALRPGGWLLASVARSAQDDLGRAVRTWQLALTGGAPWTADEVADRLTTAGFDRVEVHAPVEGEGSPGVGTPVLVAGRRGTPSAVAPA
ncbi:class I SAM-dependent methyltransferase [Actinosynnema sp. NPDC023658]|uniref:SAM-dependent methyltransferase n=1 Tax=Actinosynnema sp. NPDC023658 TaxID=3155465 RepID=UPI0033C11493